MTQESSPPPRRTSKLIDRMLEFMRTRSCFAFAREAAAVVQERLPDWPPFSDSLVNDYLLFSHRDARGRSLARLFLEHQGPRLASADRDLLQSFDHSALACYSVQGVQWGASIQLKELGSGKLIDVTEVSASRSLRVGMTLVARVVPCDGSHELLTVSPPLPAQFGYETERRWASGAAPAIPDSLTIAETIVRAIERVDRTPTNEFEATLQAQEVLRELAFPLSVEEVQRRFQTLRSPLELIREKHIEFNAEEQVERFMTALTSLWNHTPRDEFGGQTPAQRSNSASVDREQMAALAHDFLRELQERLGPPPGTPEGDAEYRARSLQLQAEWRRTPQGQLGGLTPSQVMAGQRPLPAPNELPAPDLPIFSSDALHGMRSRWELDGNRTALTWVKGRLAWLARRAGASLDFTPAANVARALIDEYRTARSHAANPHAFTYESIEAWLDDPRGDLDYLCCLVDDLLSAGREPALQLLLVLLTEVGPDIRCTTMSRLSPAQVNWVRPELMADVENARQDVVDLIELAAEFFTLGDEQLLHAVIERIVDLEPTSRDLEELAETLVAECDDDFVDAAVLPFLEEEVGDDEEFDCPDLGRFYSPRSDPAAAERAAQLLGRTPAVVEQRLERLARAGDALAQSIGLVRRALALAPASSPVTARAPCMELVLGLLERAHAGHGATSETQLAAMDLCRVWLAAALRGDLPEMSPGRARERALTPEELHARARVDVPLNAAELFGLVRQPPADLAALRDSPDHFVSFHAVAVSAVLHPDEYLEDYVVRANRTGLISRSLEVPAWKLGDRLLDAIWKDLAEDPRGAGNLPFLRCVALLGTARARAALQWFLAGTPMHVPATPLVEAVRDAGDPNLAALVLEQLRRGDLDLHRECHDAAYLADLEAGVATLVAVHDLDPKIAESTIAAVRALVEEHSCENHEHDADDTDLADSDDGRPRAGPAMDWGPLPELPDLLERSEPLQATPKPGRNDPCPCGSGRKFKKCCGAGTP
ncbi:MAG: SEC-C metal-binding domain-containing protein [Planctomycetota bacterium]